MKVTGRQPVVDLSIDRLRQLLEYDPDTGIFTSRMNGKLVGSLTEKGYLRISVGGRHYKAHRLAWFYVYGAWPLKQLDHRNGIRLDNRIANLREAGNTQQRMNTGSRVDNRSGRRGVYFSKSNRKWVAQIKSHGCVRYLGSFETVELAADAYEQAATELFGEWRRSAA